MRRRDFLRLSLLSPFGAALTARAAGTARQAATRKILIAGIYFEDNEVRRVVASWRRGLTRRRTT